MKSPRAKNAVRRLLISIFFIECIGMTSVYSQVHEAIKRAKNAVRRLLISIFFIECIGMTSVYSQVHEAIKPYVDFLSHKQLPAKDYILSLFKNHDIVFICERDHRDITQYELYLDILRDPYFTNHVGVLFTEVGSRSLNPDGICFSIRYGIATIGACWHKAYTN